MFEFKGNQTGACPRAQGGGRVKSLRVRSPLTAGALMRRFFFEEQSFRTRRATSAVPSLLLLQCCPPFPASSVSAGSCVARFVFSPQQWAGGGQKYSASRFGPVGQWQKKHE